MLKKLVTILAVILIVGVGVVAYSFLKTPEAASEPIEAIPLNLEVSERAEERSEPPAEVVSEETNTNLVVEAEQPEAIEEPDSPAAPETSAQSNKPNEAEVEAATVPKIETEAAKVEAEAAEVEPAAASPTIFEIVPAQSEARFYIDEVLRGEPTTVVGATDQVAGQFALVPDDLSTVQVGPIQVNARTLATDNQFRNRAIKNRILLTDNYEFVTFTPKEVVGLPEIGRIGETYTFRVSGDLTVTGVTRPVTFDVTATARSETQLEAVATTAFPYTDFGLSIPEVPAVDTVDDQVRLEVAFVAGAVQ